MKELTFEQVEDVEEVSGAVGGAAFGCLVGVALYYMP